MYRPSSRRAFL